MKYTSVKDLQWANSERTSILMTVNFDLIGEAPFTASATDTAEHGVQLFKDAAAGKFGPIAAWIDNRDYYGEWKIERAAKVAAIVVEVDGMLFDGDENSQNRMGRAVAIADGLEDEVSWTLADNTVAQVTVAQLKQALVLASLEQTRIWNEERPAE